jgi:hypothetical protein
MSKRDLENPSVAQETSAELPSGANSIKERSMSPLDLLKINVNDHTEKKNGLTYLSWAWAWAEALKADPKSTFKVEMFDGSPLMPVGGSFMVWITVTMFDKPMTCMLPVLDYRNKPIATPNSFDVNTSIMRCLVKAIAMHGLGLYIYAGEDTPPDEVRTEEPEKKIVKIETPTAIAEVEVDTANMQLFADSMIQFVGICENEDALKSYWKANHPQLETLKAFDKTLYTTVLARFTEAKANFKKD